MNKVSVKAESSLKGKELVIRYRSDERFIIVEELDGNRVIVLGRDKCEYCVDLSDDVYVKD